MKSLSRLGIILIGLLIIGNEEVWGADWKFYGSSQNYLGYYDAHSITRPSKNIVRVWARYDYTEKGVIDMVGNLGGKYENLSVLENLQEINCAEKKLRILLGHFYNNKGGMIDSLSNPSSEWAFIGPGTTAESLYREVCK